MDNIFVYFYCLFGQNKDEYIVVWKVIYNKGELWRNEYEMKQRSLVNTGECGVIHPEKAK